MFNLGRLPRAYSPRIPHMSALMARSRAQLEPPPMECDYTKTMPGNFGMMLNNALGDCTCAAFYHARQVWSFNATGTEQTAGDADVQALYEQACGYNPSDPTTDAGGVEQDVLAFLLNTGAPVNGDREKIAAFLEVDFRNLDDLKRAIADCGVAYIGFDVPQSVMDGAGDPSRPWDVSGNREIIGGHAVVLVGYDLDTFTCISWGQRYTMTHAFLGTFLDEAYAIADPLWIETTGKTPLGMTPAQLTAAMEGIKA